MISPAGRIAAPAKFPQASLVGPYSKHGGSGLGRNRARRHTINQYFATVICIAGVRQHPFSVAFLLKSCAHPLHPSKGLFALNIFFQMQDIHGQPQHQQGVNSIKSLKNIRASSQKDAGLSSMEPVNVTGPYSMETFLGRRREEEDEGRRTEKRTGQSQTLQQQTLKTQQATRKYPVQRNMIEREGQETERIETLPLRRRKTIHLGPAKKATDVFIEKEEGGANLTFHSSVHEHIPAPELRQTPQQQTPKTQQPTRQDLIQRDKREREVEETERIETPPLSQEQHLDPTQNATETSIKDEEGNANLTFQQFVHEQLPAPNLDENRVSPLYVQVYNGRGCRNKILPLGFCRTQNVGQKTGPAAFCERLFFQLC
jgi:hypothetical protein